MALQFLINILVGVIWMFFSANYNSEYFAVGFFWGMVILFIFRNTFAKNFLGKQLYYVYLYKWLKLIVMLDNISYAKFYTIARGRGRRDRNPTLQIFDSEEKKLVEMTISAMDYYSLKKYFEKYNVTIDNQYKEF